jgi:hypothetical protein
MGLTQSQIKTIWLAQQQINNPRYSFFTNAQKIAFNNNLLTNVYPGIITHLTAKYGGNVIDLNTQLNIDLDGVAPSMVQSISSPPSPTTRSIVIGWSVKTSTNIYAVIKTNNQMYQSGPDVSGNYYINFYSGDIVDNNGNQIVNVNGLSEVWVFNGDPYKIGSVNPTIGRTNDRFQNQQNTWDPLQPNMFAVNTYFLVTISPNMYIWINIQDPTQRVKWLNGIMFVSNLTPLDQGLNSEIYNPNHPELIDPGWSLVSHSGINWEWAFSYSDSTYRLFITQQTNGSYQHHVSFNTMTPSEWFDQYVGAVYGYPGNSSFGVLPKS